MSGDGINPYVLVVFTTATAFFRLGVSQKFIGEVKKVSCLVSKKS